ncbi:MAG: hypothetical protein HON07_03170 [Planctomycetaceae bacterium]|jgi:CheY-like chemotaxis protein/HPt (histidine-containing phosphotransfer) domain-containing protein|nr:hypothetical protein [Planctomycetaceae bacterium]
MSEAPDAKLDAMLDGLRRDFAVTAKQKLADLDSQLLTLSSQGKDDPEIVSSMRREIHSLKGMGGTFGFPAITTISHRLEDFIASVGGIVTRADDVLVFIDCLSDILESEPQPDNDELSRIVRNLPAGKKGPVVDSVLRELEVLVIVPNQVLRTLLQHHLEQNGCRVVGIDSPFEAIELCVRTLPDLVVSSVVIKDIDGIDLLRTLDVMKSTQAIELAVLTSLALDDPQLEQLPEKAWVISTGEDMGNDFLEVLTNLR